MPHDDLDHIPPIVPTRDGDHQGNTSSTEPGGVARNRLTRHSSQPAVMSASHLLAPLTAIVALLVVTGAAAAGKWPDDELCHPHRRS